MYQKAKIYQTGCDYEIKMRAFLENKLAAKKDMLKISDVSHMLGYCKETIRRWIENHYLNAYLVKQHIFIAKEDLITFMLSEHFGEIRIKSEAHKAMLISIIVRSIEYRVIALKNKTLEEMSERLYEYGLPDYFQHDLNMYKEALKNGSSLLDCYWGELYGSINMVEISEGSISSEYADYLR